MNILNDDLNNAEDWIKIENYEEEIKNFGTVKSKYITLTTLKASIPPPTKKEILKLKGRIGRLSIFINAPLLIVHSILSDIDSKKQWIKGLKKIENKNKINRINATHNCEFSNVKMDITTLANQVYENEITFTEEGFISEKIKIISEFVLKEIDGGTNVILRFYSRGSSDKNFIDKIKFKFVLKTLMKMMKLNLKRLKKYCEEDTIQ